MVRLDEWEVRLRMGWRELTVEVRMDGTGDDGVRNGGRGRGKVRM
jgi:hypothetical protein